MPTSVSNLPLHHFHHPRQLPFLLQQHPLPPPPPQPRSRWPFLRAICRAHLSGLAWSCSFVDYAAEVHQKGFLNPNFATALDIGSNPPGLTWSLRTKQNSKMLCDLAMKNQSHINGWLIQPTIVAKALDGQRYPMHARIRW